MTKNKNAEIWILGKKQWEWKEVRFSLSKANTKI